MKIAFPKSLLIIVLLLSALFITSCEMTPPTRKNLAAESMIPMPAFVMANGSSFRISPKTAIVVEGDSESALKVGQYLASHINSYPGRNIQVISEPNSNSSIVLKIDTEKEIGNPEGYSLEIKEDQINLYAIEPVGLFRGVQTLIQLLPPVTGDEGQQEIALEIASGNIEDAPEYGYRGTMLDVARHFFSVGEVKQYIDYMALYKFNYLHLHLSDDQGWRIEIKSWPNLTTHGGSLEVGGGKGGFYTQEEYQDLVAYAQERYITIVPEIDMPGHTNAALASYAELNCSGKATDLYTGTEVGFSTFCTDKEVTYQFVDDVIRELVAITPGLYIHIGGDESHVTEKDDYIYFINRVQEIVYKYNKTMIGWDEVAEAELRPVSIAQYWDKAENARKAIEKGAKVLVSPAKMAYMDMQYDSTSRIGLHWAAYIEVDAGYNWDPAGILPEMKKENILGVEAPLWTETVTNLDDIEYLVFPRMPGYAEVGWTPKPLRNWEEYKVRLAGQQPYWESMGINYYPSALVPWE